MRFLACITRSLFDGGGVIGMTKCEGVPSLRSTHCVFCEYYERFRLEDDCEIEDPVVMETERAEWS